MLISHVLCCFSDLVCCRSLVQFVVQRGEIKQSWNLGPYQCYRALLVRSSALHSSSRARSSACLVSRISCVALAGPGLHLFNTCAVGILRQLRAIDRTLCDRTYNTRSNAHRPRIELTALQSSAEEPTIERTPCDLAHPRDRQHIKIVYK